MTIRSFRRAHARRLEREHRRLANAKHKALVAGATLGASAVFATSAQAAGTTYTVTTNGDDNPAVACNSDNTCATLRDAINAANNDGGGDTIQFASGLAGQTITLTPPGSGGAGALTIDSGNNTIDNPNAPGLAVSADSDSQVFVNDAPTGTTTTISGLTIEDGAAGDGDGGAIDTPEGSGDTAGAGLVLTSDLVRDSNAEIGGGVFADGPLAISSSQITGNSAFGGGGVSAKYGTSSITNSTISNNTAKYGGGITNATELTISGSQVTGNTSSEDAGGIGSDGGTLSITGTSISDNTAARRAGGLSVYSENSTSLSNDTVANNSASDGDAGGIFVAGETGGGGSRLEARKAAVEKRYSITLPRQMAALANAGGPISISDSTISGNTATGSGGGVDVDYLDANSPLTISASTISGNTSGSFGGGILVADYGNALYSPFQLIDSTVSGNSANDGGGASLGTGSGQVLKSGGSIAFDNSTIASNTASGFDGGGGIYESGYSSGSPAAENSPTATIFSTIVARNAGNDLARAAGSTSGGYNVSYSLVEFPGDAPLLTSQSVIKGVDPQLGPLADNGGPTETMLPAETSPVIDQGKDSPGLTTDQRGDARTVYNGRTEPPGGDGTDIGAVELAKIPIVAIIEPATGITGWHATLNGKITTNTEAVAWYFQYGTTTNYGHQTTSGAIAAGGGQVPVSFQITGLRPHKLYHYRLVGVAANGYTSYSADATFRTLTPTIKPTPGTVKAGDNVRVHGFAAGCKAGDRVTLISDVFGLGHMYFGRRAVYSRVKSGGYYSVTTTIPKTRDAGRYAITARCGGNSFAVTAYLHVTAPSAAVKPVTVVRFTG